MSKAEALISAKLRQSYENDLQAMAPQSMMFPGLHPMAMMATSNIGYTSRGSGFPGGLYGSGPAPYPSMYQSALPSQPGGQPGGDGLVRATDDEKDMDSWLEEVVQEINSLTNGKQILLPKTPVKRRRRKGYIATIQE
ncbi:unnamed protein product, partial [Timema podura]|nr:unnamed protein product [Timema podura]